MKDPYVKIRLSELTYLRNTISLLRQRLSKYEEPEPEIKLVNRDGSPTGNNPKHPFAKTGPKNMLDSLPDSFSESQLEKLRTGLGMETEKNTKNQLKKWVWRKYITYDMQTGLYTKTHKYIERLKQARLIDITDDNIVNIVN